MIGKNKDRLSLRQILALGGGVLSAGQNRFMHLSVRDNGYEVGEEVTDDDLSVFGDGSVLVVARGQKKKTAQIELLGQTRKPGFYDLGRHANLSSVLGDPQVLGEDIYPLIGVIARWDAERLVTRYLNYPVRAVLKKEKDFNLEDNDKIYFFSTQDISRIFRTKETNRMVSIGGKKTLKKIMIFCWKIRRWPLI